MADAVLDSSVPAAICSCGATQRHATAEDRCERGHVLVGNATARKHGVYAFENRGPAALPADLRVSLDQFRAQLISDCGGIDDLTAIEAARIRRLVELETIVRMLTADIAQRGLFTARGRPRSTLSYLLQSHDRWDREAQRLPPGRRPRQVLTLAERLAAAPLTTIETEDHDAGD